MQANCWCYHPIYVPLLSCLFPLSFPSQFRSLHAFIFSIYTTCGAQLILLNLITTIISCEVKDTNYEILHYVIMSVRLLGLPPPTIKSLWAEQNYAQLLAPKLSQWGWCLHFSLQWFIPHCVLPLSFCLQSVAYMCLASALYFADNFIMKYKVRAVKPQSASLYLSASVFWSVQVSSPYFQDPLMMLHILIFVSNKKGSLKFLLVLTSFYCTNAVVSPYLFCGLS